jgi:4-hydroxybenzoate polyprenyltransferase
MSSAEMPVRVSTATAWLQLARVSNTATVVSNTVAGAVLASTVVPVDTVAVVAVAMALFYTAGMVLNDVLDLEIDRRHRPERPLPSGVVTKRAATTAVAGLFLAGAVMLAVVDVAALAAGVALIGLIVLYDAWHKGNIVGPVLMGGCRALVYVVAALAVTQAVPWEVWTAGLLLLLYIVGLTEVAKAEATGRSPVWPVAAVLAPVPWFAFQLPSPESFLLLAAFALGAVRSLRLVLVMHRIGPAVTSLIAGVALFDAVAVASVSGPLAAVLVCLAAFAATLALQTKIAGT